jgi:hypothetical protein
MDQDFLKWLTSLGVGGVLAGGMFWVYRKDALVIQQRLLAIADKLLDTLAQVHSSMAQVTTLLQQIAQRMNGGKSNGRDE